MSSQLQCVTCGDFVVSFKSHKPFCKGVDKGKPWLMLPLTKENVRAWGDSVELRKWAKHSGISLSKLQEE